MEIFPRQVVGQDVRCSVKVVQSSWEDKIFSDDDFTAFVTRLRQSFEKAKQDKAGLHLTVHQVEEEDEMR
jgi:hypothetical protein